MEEKKISLFLRVRYALAYAVVRAFWWFTENLPECLAIRLGSAAGRLSARLNASRRRRAHRNIERALGGELTPREVRRLLRDAAVHVGLTTAETCWLRKRIRRPGFEDRFPVEGLDVLQAELAKGRGVICFSSHIGNWQFFGAIQALRLGGFSAPIRSAKNPFLRAFMTRLRRSVGIREISTRRGVRPMVAALKRGEFLVILIDQHARGGAVPATFFGRPAATTGVVAALALRLGVPVFHAYSFRDGCTFRHHGYIEGPLELIRTGDYDADVQANTQRFNDLVEQVVRRHPEQWFGWAFPRWKLADKGPS